MVASLYTLPNKHPIRDVLARAERRSQNVGALPRFPLAEVIKTMDQERLHALETIDPRPLAPWNPPEFKEINIDSDRDRAIERAEALAASLGTVVYSDASANQDQLGAAAVILDHAGKVVTSQQIGVGPKTHWSIHAAELIGIYYSIELARMHRHGRWCSSATNKPDITIISDSQSALKAIANPSNRTCQHIIYAIFKAA